MMTDEQYLFWKQCIVIAVGLCMLVILSMLPEATRRENEFAWNRSAMRDTLLVAFDEADMMRARAVFYNNTPRMEE